MPAPLMATPEMWGTDAGPDMTQDPVFDDA